MSVIETALCRSHNNRADALLNVKDLRVTFSTPDGDVTAVNDLNFSLRAGETLGIRKSWSGKSPNRICVDGLVGCHRTYWRIGNLQWA